MDRLELSLIDITLKYSNTVKLLIGITPKGVVSYISGAWGGRVSDNYLTEHCGILKKHSSLYLFPIVTPFNQISLQFLHMTFKVSEF